MPQLLFMHMPMHMNKLLNWRIVGARVGENLPCSIAWDRKISSPAVLLTGEAEGDLRAHRFQVPYNKGVFLRKHSILKAWQGFL